MGDRATYLKVAAACGGLAVAAGAFGAHGLEARLSDSSMDVYQTAVTYHFYHALALLAVTVSGPARLWTSPWPGRACAAWVFGVIVFSGSLYALALTEMGWLGAITPIGGVAFIVGWVFLAFVGRNALSGAE